MRTQDDVITCARHMHTDSLAPIFLTSSVTGQGLDLIRTFYNLLPQRHKWWACLMLFPFPSWPCPCSSRSPMNLSLIASAEQLACSPLGMLPLLRQEA